MILDKIENANLFKGINSGINKAFLYIQSPNISNLTNGKHEIDGDDVFAIVMEYDTKDITDDLLESHLKYIDVHYIAEGIENIGMTTLVNQKTIKLYDDVDDYMLFKEPFDLITLNKGMFAIFFPDDIHLPGIISGNTSMVKKIVVKAKI